MQAVILAAGEGTRVRPLTRSRPKALIPVANRPVIDYVIESLTESGIRDIVVVVGYRREQVIRHLNGLDIPVRVVVQERQLGTAHALACAADEISGDFILMPGDNYIDPESIGRIRDLPDSMLVFGHPEPSEFGVVTIRDSSVVDVVEKPKIAPSFTVSTGIFHFSPRVFSYLDDEMDIPGVVSRMIADGIRIRAIHASRWQDAIYPWDFIHLNARLLEGVTP
ncbi:MAG: sugar phosphate nucleotidyltransferase, partial [Methanoculleaceae archaeon]